MAYARLLDDDAPGYDELSCRRAAARSDALLLALVGRRWLSGRTRRACGTATRGRHAPGDLGRGRPFLRRGAPRHHRLSTALLTTIPLQVHARYQREEILGALDFHSERANSFREGVWYSAGPQRRRLLRHAQEVRGGLLADHDVPRLSDLARRCSTGSRSPRRPCTSQTGQRYLNGSRAACCSFVRHAAEGRVRHLALPLPRARSLRRAHRGSSDRDHLAARARAADRLLRHRHARSRSSRDRPSSTVPGATG